MIRKPVRIVLIACVAPFIARSAAVAAPATIPELPAGKADEVALPGKVAEVTAGAGGRLLIFALAQEKKIVVFDVSTGKITRTLSIDEPRPLIAAGRTKLYVGLRKKKVLQRWSLETFAREAEGELPLVEMRVSDETRVMPPAAASLEMGSESDGPLLMAGASPRVNILRFDPATLEQIEAPPSMETGPIRLRVSADGSWLGSWHSGVSPDGLDVTSLEEPTPRLFRFHMETGAVVPSANGVYYSTARGSVYDIDGMSAVGKTFNNPAPAGRFEGLPATSHDAAWVVFFNAQGTMTFGSAATMKPVIQLTGLSELSKVASSMAAFMDYPAADKRVHFYPAFNRLVTLAAGNDKLLVRSIELSKTLAALKSPALLSAPLPASAGKAFAWTIATGGGGTTRPAFALATGPTGLTVSADGKVAWKTPVAGKQRIVLDVSTNGAKQQWTVWLDVRSGSGHGPTTAALTTAPAGTSGASVGAMAKRSVKLDAAADLAAQGGAGRFWVLRLPEANELVVVDTKTAKITAHVPADGKACRFAVGRSKLVAANYRKGRIERWDLATGKKELAVDHPFDERINFMATGSDAEGPVFIQDRKGLVAIDLKTLTLLKVSGLDDLAGDLQEAGFWVGPDGKTLIIKSLHQGMNTLLLRQSGDAFERRKLETSYASSFNSNTAMRPSADGKYIAAGSVVFDATVPDSEKHPELDGRNLSAEPRLIPIDRTTRAIRVSIYGREETRVCIVDLSEPARELIKLPLLSEFTFVYDKLGAYGLMMDQRICYSAAEHVLTTLSADNRVLTIRTVDLTR